MTEVSQLTHYYNSQKIKRVKASHPVAGNHNKSHPHLRPNNFFPRRHECRHHPTFGACKVQDTRGQDQARTTSTVKLDRRPRGKSGEHMYMLGRISVDVIGSCNGVTHVE